MLTITGKDLEGDKKELDGYFATLDRWSKSPRLPSRTRFMVRDVLDLRRSRWVPRREALQVRPLCNGEFFKNGCAVCQTDDPKEDIQWQILEERLRYSPDR